MLGYIAFCPHFHQPHFQLAKTREEVFQASYEPWLRLLEETAERYNSFFISLHFSGPWLYWISQEKAACQKQLIQLAARPQIGITGGLADEPFMQLSSRSDDFYFQMREYERICRLVTGASGADWQSIHIVERECGEFALLETSRAARLCRTLPVFLLDAETFYPASFTKPGAGDDLGRMHYGFPDPYSLTTGAHLPPEMLLYPLRDEIGGQEFFALPLHSQFRYQLLKRKALAEGDRLYVEPLQYLFYIKDRLEQAAVKAAALGHRQPPVAAIFEDAEKLGQWSGDSAGDVEWLRELFARVIEDHEVEFTGPRKYMERHGYFTTYPVASSHSYPEWEKWTARRGIRGLNLVDERLRKTIARLRDAELLLERWERQVLERLGLERAEGDLERDLRDRVERTIMSSPERFAIIGGMMDPAEMKLYELINRIRHLAYQEDPKWASRHPGYGAAPYFDIQSLACLESALTLLQEVNPVRILPDSGQPQVQSRDWDHDGQEEWIMSLPGQYVVIDAAGGCVAYYSRVNPALVNEPSRLQALLEQELRHPGSSGLITDHAGPLVLTEIDSELGTHFYSEGGRVDHCRNSFRCEVWQGSPGIKGQPAGFHNSRFEYESSRVDVTEAELVISASLSGWQAGAAIMKKKFTLNRQGLAVEVSISVDAGPVPELVMVLEAVTSAAPSDELCFQPVSFIGFSTQPSACTALWMEPDPSDHEDGYKAIELESLGLVSEAVYVFQINNRQAAHRRQAIRFSFGAGREPAAITVKPAVKNYLEGLVFPRQSRMGYGSSGVRLELAQVLQGGHARLQVAMDRIFDAGREILDFERIVSLAGTVRTGGSYGRPLDSI